MKVEDVNILIAGVGGQGNILAARIIAKAAMRNGYQATVGQTFGASQRGGSVVSHLRIGPAVFSPLIPKGRGHVVVGLEPIETLRVAVDYLSPAGIAIVNTKPLLPVSVKSGVEKYPEIDEIVKYLKEVAREVIPIDASTLAEKAGSALATNIVMLGTLMGTKMLPVSTASVEEAIKESVPRRTINTNLRAFKFGLDVISKSK